MIYSGKVQRRKGRGTQLGFPTANLQVPGDSPEGIFVAWVNIEKDKLPSLFFIGSAVTFNETEKQGEVYIFDFSKDLYGKEIEVEILEKLRDNEMFESSEELVRQMRDDERKAKKFFENLK